MFVYVYPSYTVLNIFDFVTGTRVFLLTNGVITPPTVSIPNVSGITSNNNIPLDESSPFNEAA